MRAVIDRPPPPALRRDDPGGDGRWVRVFRAGGDIEAHLLSGRLNEAGIETSFLRDGRGAAWLLAGADPHAPVDILVRKMQLDDARLVLAEISYEQPFPSKAASRPTWKSALVWWATALALGLALTGISLARTSQQLDACESSLSCAGGRP